MSAFDPLEVVHVDLERGLPGPLRGERDAFAVLWWRDLPLGHAELTRAEQASPAALAARVSTAIAPAVGRRVVREGFEAVPPSRLPPPPGPAPPLGDLLALREPLTRLAEEAGAGGEDPAATSLIVCTRGRPHDLERCLRAHERLRVKPAETLVVDNAPADPATRRVVEGFDGVTWLPEPRAGLSVARNAGVRAARGSVLAFVDDDTEAHERWLERLLRGFAHPGVLAVTGLVLPARLDHRAQVVFEKSMGSSGRGYRPLSFDAGFFEPQIPFGVPVWAIGAGANMAIRRTAFDRVGLFDERLGAGAAGCSEDSELWYRILVAGGECRYEPDAVVLHWHRADMRALRRQAHDYLRGHVAGLFVQRANHGHNGNLRRVALTVPRHLLRRLPSEIGLGSGSRTGTYAAEVTGYLAGMRHWRLARRAPRAA